MSSWGAKGLCIYQVSRTALPDGNGVRFPKATKSASFEMFLALSDRMTEWVSPAKQRRARSVLQNLYSLVQVGRGGGGATLPTAGRARQIAWAVMLAWHPRPIPHGKKHREKQVTFPRH